jgi:hypothetical protein
MDCLVGIDEDESVFWKDIIEGDDGIRGSGRVGTDTVPPKPALPHPDKGGSIDDESIGTYDEGELALDIGPFSGIFSCLKE